MAGFCNTFLNRPNHTILPDMNLTSWKSKGSFLNYKNHKVFYIDDGGGSVRKPIVVLIHGFPTASFDWWKVWVELSKNFRLITADMTGFGFSDKPVKYNYSIFDQANLFEELLCHLKVEKCFLFSHDYGDTVAQELVARANDNELGFEIEALCLLNGGLFPESYKPRLIQKLLMSPLGPLVSRLSSKNRLRKTFRNIFGPETQLTEKEIDECWELMTMNGGKAVIHKTICYMRERSVNADRWLSALQNTKVPMRLIDGAFDPISGIHLVNRYKELIQNPDVVVLDQIGHYPQLEAPDLILKHFLEFINRFN